MTKTPEKRCAADARRVLKAPRSRSIARARPCARADPPARPHAVRHRRRGRGADENHLLDADAGEFLDQPAHELGPVADMVPLAAPVAVGGKLHRLGRGGDRQAQRAVEKVHEQRALRSGEVDDLRLAGAGARPPLPRTARARAAPARAPTRSRRASRSCTATSTSRNPGWPRLSVSTST